MVPQVARWWFVVITVLHSTTKASVCNFPQFLFAKGRVWEKHITNQRGGDVEYHRYFESYANITISTKGGATERFSVVCEKNVGNDTFIVSHVTSRWTKYQCVQFLQRSFYVIQLSVSPMRRKMHASLCRPQRMRIDEWPMVFPSLRTRYVPCGLPGGYSVDIADGESGYYVCSDIYPRPRLESECLTGEGIKLDFKEAVCIPKGLAMVVKQQLYCLATWKDGRNTFIVLTDNAYAPHTWMLRVSDIQKQRFTGYLLRDVVADNDDIISMSKGYIRIDFVRNVVDSLCPTELEPIKQGCLKKSCHYKYAESCSRHCNSCNITSSEENCSFDEDLWGSWIDHQTNWFPHPSHKKRKITITKSNITINGFSSFMCPNLNGLSTAMRRTPVVRTFENGCTPRYACVHLHKVSQSILRYRLSQSTLWPLLQGVNNHHEICKNENFRFDVLPLIETYRNVFEKNLISSTIKRTSVNCNIRTHFTFKAYFADGRRCYGSISEKCNNSNVMALELNNCVGRRNFQYFNCLASFEESGVGNDKSNYRILITESQQNPDETMCWIINVNMPYGNKVNMYMLAASECNKATHDAISVYGYKKALIYFKFIRENNIICNKENGYKGGNNVYTNSSLLDFGLLTEISTPKPIDSKRLQKDKPTKSTVTPVYMVKSAATKTVIMYKQYLYFFTILLNTHTFIFSWYT